MVGSCSGEIGSLFAFNLKGRGLHFPFSNWLTEPKGVQWQKWQQRLADEGPKAEAVFKALDANSDGTISVKELADSKRFKDDRKKDVGAAFKQKDLNGDGKISQHEFNKTFGQMAGNRSGQKDGDNRSADGDTQN